MSGVLATHELCASRLAPTVNAWRSAPTVGGTPTPSIGCATDRTLIDGTTLAWFTRPRSPAKVQRYRLRGSHGMSSRSATAGIQARWLLLSEYHGVLSTISVDVPGYPFGSVVPYCLDRRGWPVLLISRIAQHTKNAWADPKVSLTISEPDLDDVQTGSRLTYLGDIQQVTEPDEDTAERYYRYFPQSRDYHRTHDFDFYVIAPVRVRYIGGFGEIFWLSPEQLVRPNPFSPAEETDMVDHMNTDHEAAMRTYCKTANIPLTPETQPQFAGVDAEGFHLRLGARIVRFNFPSPVSKPLEVRQQLVAMARGGHDG
jgi:heme iron utilization protein